MELDKAKQQLYYIAVGVGYGMVGKADELAKQLDSKTSKDQEEKPSGDSVGFNPGKSVSI